LDITDDTHWQADQRAVGDSVIFLTPPPPGTQAGAEFYGIGTGDSKIAPTPKTERAPYDLTTPHSDVRMGGTGPGPTGGQGIIAPALSPGLLSSPTDLTVIKQELEDTPLDSERRMEHPPTRHSPPRHVQMPYPSVPLPTPVGTRPTRARTKPKIYDPVLGHPKPQLLVSKDRGGEDMVAGTLLTEDASLDTSEYFHDEAYENDENYLSELDRQLELRASCMWSDHLARELKESEDIEDLVTVCDSILSCFTDYSNTENIVDEEAMAVKERLTQQSTPMRELTPEEIEKFEGLVDSARALEYGSFMSEETFKIIPRAEIPPHPDGTRRRIVSTRELIQWKQYLLKVKLRVVLRGFQDDRRRSNPYYSVDSPTLRSDSMRCIFQLAADNNWDIYTWDLKTAFLQGFKYEHENELVYWDPPPKFREYFHMKPNEYAVAIKSIYGLDDAPRKWYEKLAAKLIDAILDNVKWKKGGFGCKRHWLDPCLFMKHGWNLETLPSGNTPEYPGGTFTPEQLPQFTDISIAGTRRKPNLDGNECTLAAGTHVDDIIATGKEDELRALNDFLETVFNVGARSRASDKGGLVYRGVRIKKVEDFHITIDMREYEERELIPIQDPSYPKRVSQTLIGQLLPDKGQAWYRAVVGKCIWVSCQTRPDITCQVSQASSQLGKATVPDAILVNKIIQHVADNPLTLQY
jgi:hypothetical protein